MQCSSFTFGNKFLRPNAKRLSNKITENTLGRAERANWRPLRPINGGPVKPAGAGIFHGRADLFRLDLGCFAPYFSGSSPIFTTKIF